MLISFPPPGVPYCLILWAFGDGSLLPPSSVWDHCFKNPLRLAQLQLCHPSVLGCKAFISVVHSLTLHAASSVIETQG